MSKNVKGVLVDVENGFFGEATLDGELESYYNALKCNCIDIAPRCIGSKRFAIYCDDEGLLKEDPCPSAFTPGRGVTLVGNLFIAQVDEHGETVSLTDSEIELVLSRIEVALLVHHDKLHIAPYLLLDDEMR